MIVLVNYAVCGLHQPDQPAIHYTVECIKNFAAWMKFFINFHENLFVMNSW